MALENSIEEIANAIDNVSEQFGMKNQFGMSIGDELHSIDWHLRRIAEALEKIANK